MLKYALTHNIKSAVHCKKIQMMTKFISIPHSI